MLYNITYFLFLYRYFSDDINVRSSAKREIFSPYVGPTVMVEVRLTEFDGATYEENFITGYLDYY